MDANINSKTLKVRKCHHLHTYSTKLPKLGSSSRVSEGRVICASYIHTTRQFKQFKQKWVTNYWLTPPTILLNSRYYWAQKSWIHRCHFCSQKRMHTKKETLQNRTLQLLKAEVIKNRSTIVRFLLSFRWPSIPHPGSAISISIFHHPMNLSTARTCTARAEFLNRLHKVKNRYSSPRLNRLSFRCNWL